MAQININDFIDSNGNVIGSAKMIKDLVSSNNEIDLRISSMTSLSFTLLQNQTKTLTLDANASSYLITTTVALTTTSGLGYFLVSVWGGAYSSMFTHKETSYTTVTYNSQTRQLTFVNGNAQAQVRILKF